MEIEKISNRHILFKYTLPKWDLKLHLIRGQKNNYVIDTGLGSESVAPIKEYLGNDAKPIIVINTHHHWDHVWGNNCFNDCVIVSHRLCRERMLSKWAEMIEKNGKFIRGDATMCLPNLTFEDTMFFPEDKIRIFYAPGHTTDGINVLDEEEMVLNVGDNIGDNMDEIVPELEMEKSVYLESLAKYKALNITTCVSGHNIILGNEIFEAIEKQVMS